MAPAAADPLDHLQTCSLSNSLAVACYFLCLFSRVALRQQFFGEALASEIQWRAEFCTEISRFPMCAIARFASCVFLRRPRRSRLQHQDEGPGQGVHHWPVRNLFALFVFCRLQPIIARAVNGHHQTPPDTTTFSRLPECNFHQSAPPTGH